MNLKIGVFLLLSHLVFAQSEKRIKGTVLYNNSPMSKVDVVNIQSRNGTQTNRSGEFEITYSTGDTLVFISKDYQLRRIKLTEKKISESPFIIEMYLKPEELKEVIVMKMPSFKLDRGSKYENQKLNEIEMDKLHTAIKNPYIYDGQTAGIDFIKLGKLVVNLLASSHKNKEKVPDKKAFTAIVNQHFETDYLLKTLHLEKEQLLGFLEFCEYDSHSKSVNEKSNPLTVLDFLLKKREEFQKLP